MRTVSSNYEGKVLEHLQGLILTGNELFENNLVNLITEVTEKVSIPRIRLSSILGPRVVTPTTSLGSSAYEEVQLTPSETMLYHEFNPRNYDAIWEVYQTSGQLVFRELPEEVQMAFLEEVYKYVSFEFGRMFVQGDTGGGSAPLNLMNGFETVAAADANVLRTTGAVALTNANIQAAFEAVEAEFIANNAESVLEAPGFAYVCSYASWRLYRQAVQNQSNKGVDFTQEAPMFFNGKRIIKLAGMPNDSIIATHWGTDRTSNAHLAVDWNRDSVDSLNGVLKIDRLQSNSEMFFVKGNFKMAAGFRFPEEVALYKP